MTTAVDTRQRILDAAKRLFAERGYAATSLADIAAEVGLTKTAVAYHFHPKDRLAAELITPAADDALVLLGRDFGGDSEAFIIACAEFSVRHREIVRLFLGHIGAAQSAGDPLSEAIRMMHDEFFARIAGGEDPAPAVAVRAMAAMGAIYEPVAHLSDVPEDILLETITKAALAAFRAT